MIELAGKVAAVTGAASGIGLAIARALAREAAAVALLDVRPAELDDAVNALRGNGAEAIGIVVDVTDMESVETAAREVIDRFGRIDILVNSAGVVVRGVDLADAPDELWGWILGVNVYGLIHCLRAFVPLIQRHGEGGHIVNVGSVSGFLSARRQTGLYTTTKYAITGLTESLAHELEDSGIGVSLLLPGGVDTPLYASSAELRGSLGGANKFAAPLAEAASFMAADQVAEHAIAGIKANRLFIATHPECRALHEERHQRLMAAYDAADSLARA